MGMTGEIVLIHKYGWACARECEIKFHDNITRDINGKILNTIRKSIIYIDGLYNVEGNVKEGVTVEAIIKHDDTAELVMYKGKAVAHNKIHITSKLNNDKTEIKDKIDNLKNRRK